MCERARCSARSARSPASLALAAALAIVGAVGCKGSPRSGHAPFLSNLAISNPSLGQGSGGGKVRVAFRVDASDGGADVNGVTLVIQDASGAEVSRYTVPLPPGPPDETSTILSGHVVMPTVTLGNFTLQIQASDAAGATSNVVSGALEVVPVPTLTSISPTHAPAGTAVTLTVSGSGFATGVTVFADLTPLATTYVDGATLRAEVPPHLLTRPRTIPVMVQNPGEIRSASTTFTIDWPATNPVPTIIELWPHSAQAGSSDVALRVTGAGFVPSSSIQWNGGARPTTFVNETTLTTSLASSDLQAIGSARVAVASPAPGGGTSSSLTFEIARPTLPGVTPIALTASDLVWEPFARKLYASVPGTSATAPNSVVAIDPITARISATGFAGSEPGPIAVSDDGAYVYVGLGGAPAVQRLSLPALSSPLEISLGRHATAGAYYARSVQAQPGAPRTVAVSFAPLLSSTGTSGLAVFDDATARPTAVEAAASPLESLQWGEGAQTGTLYAASPASRDLVSLSVNASGVSVTRTLSNALADPLGDADRIHYDAGTGLLFEDAGRALDPATGVPVGTYAAPGLDVPFALAPDSGLGAVYLVGSARSGSGASLELRAYDLARFTKRRSLALPYVAGPVRRAVRFGADGIAILTGSEIVLVRGEIVLPTAATANPAPVVASLSPASAAAGGGSFRLTVAGSGFVPGSVVRWNGSERTTRFADDGHLVAWVPASDVATAGSASVTVVSPLPGGGSSGAAIFTVQ